MKAAIVIGASGFLGGHVLDALMNEGYRVYAVVHRRIPEAGDIHLIHGGIKALTPSLIDEISPEFVFHCARPTIPRFRRFGRKLSARLAHRYNKSLLERMRSTDTKPLLVFSSGSLVYGNSDVPHKEKIDARPISYARQYYHGEKPFIRAISRSQYPMLVFRLPWLLGAGSWFRWFYMDPSARGTGVPIFPPADNMMEIIDVRDAAQLMLHFAMEKQSGIINIRGAGQVTQQDFAGRVSQVFNSEVKPYQEVFSGKLESEAIEAFRSNILLESRFAEFYDGYDFISISRSLAEIRSGSHQ